MVYSNPCPTYYESWYYTNIGAFHESVATKKLTGKLPKQLHGGNLEIISEKKPLNQSLDRYHQSQFTSGVYYLHPYTLPFLKSKYLVRSIPDDVHSPLYVSKDNVLIAILMPVVPMKGSMALLRNNKYKQVTFDNGVVSKIEEIDHV